MRIIAGKYKGRILKIPPAKFTRPTTDKTKEALFNYLNNVIDFEGILMCDIYAGSGSLGLEALSRGAREIHFVEKNFAVVKILQQNISMLKAGEYTKIFKLPAVRFSKMKNHAQYDLIFADPPFFKDDIHIVAENILNNGFLSSNGIFLIERSVQTKEKDIEAFGAEPFKQLGDSLIYSLKVD